MNEAKPSDLPPLSQSARLHPLAMLSVIFSAAVFCPIATLIGPILGIKVLRDLKHDRSRRGGGYAVAAIVIGGMLTLLWVGGGIPFAIWWQAKAREPMQRGPAKELQAALVGDYDTFRSGFVGPGAEATDDEVIAFAAAVTNRYGRFVGSAQDPDGAASAYRGENELRIPYVFTFETGSVRAAAVFVLSEPGRPRLFKWRSVTLFSGSAAEADLVYPGVGSAAVVDEAPLDVED